MRINRVEDMRGRCDFEVVVWVLIFLFLGRVCSPAQEKIPIMFWNVENYFDPFDDPAVSDDEFTPTGDKRWSWSRFIAKRNSIAKTIIYVKEIYGDFPPVVGFAEVENYLVLSQLVRDTPLAKLQYKVIHRNSGDKRGIDVAFIYREGVFIPKQVKQIQIPNIAGSHIRSILMVKGMLPPLKDTLFFFVCHSPSKWGGAAASSPKREALSLILKQFTDSILAVSPHSDIVVMGDFNDTPDSKAARLLEGNLENLATPLSLEGKGTIKYKGKWEMIDHFLISTSFRRRKMEIFSQEFLLEKDHTYLGDKPFRTFRGPKYLGGVSDHLPIILLIEKNL